MAGVNLGWKHGSEGLDKLQRAWIDPPKDRPWEKLPLDVIKGDAWRSLSVNARRALYAMICWHYRHFQKENGNIRISHRQFMEAGMSHNFVADAIHELEAASLISIKKDETAWLPKQSRIARELPVFDFMNAPAQFRINMYDIVNVDGNGNRELADYVNAARKQPPFTWVTLDVMESAAWCGLSLAARLIMDRLLIENAGNAAQNNGKLKVFFDQFAEHGVCRRWVARPVKELVDAGFIAVTSGKRRGKRRLASVYRITFRGTVDDPATWRKPAELDAPVAQVHMERDKHGRNKA